MADQRRPLADRLRPTTLAEVVGQRHLVAEGKPLYQMVGSNSVQSMILWGPPGVGKTTLARIIAHSTGRAFHELSAVSAGKDELRAVMTSAKRDSGATRDLFSLSAPEQAAAPILFLDEIHRFNKAQQDYLLPFVEDGTIILIGATTENPSFEVIPALLSRSRVFVLESLTEDDLREIVRRGAALLDVTVDHDALDFLTAFANGDGRAALNLLESAADLYARETRSLTLSQIKNALQSKHLRYDKTGEEHYNTISAFIKSMRASDPDAALYYLARMVNAGEDPVFIARRMVIFASEDVGIADANALVVANAVFRAVETIGYPECQINLAHGTVYLATAPKSRDSYQAYFAALEDVRKMGNLPIPMPLRNTPTRLMRELGYGSGEIEGDRLPDALKGNRYLRHKAQT
ncbi:MAG: AAA family ATPase [Phototrophicales bacterium]|nr:MAG: AAA family ATPase [Phototrophicales bacterium]